MSINKKPFVNYTLDEDKHDNTCQVINIKCKNEELEMFKDGGLRIGQAKKSTIIKMLASIGYAKVVQDDKMIQSILNSYRRNKRLGIPEIRAELNRNFSKSNTK